MLYQTRYHHHHHHHSHSLPLSAAPSSSLPLLSSFVQEMERVEAALKSSIRKEMAFRLIPPAFSDDLTTSNAQNGVPADDFSVDDLLDLSNDDVFDKEEQTEAEEEDDEQDKQHKVSVFPIEQRDEANDNQTRYTNFSNFGSVTAEELAVPADELADLEWLSRFVEDSESYLAAAYPGCLTGQPTQPATHVTEDSCFKSPIPAKARSKRTRSGIRLWSLGSSSLTDSSTSGSTTSSSSSSPTNTTTWLARPSPISELLEPVAFEKPKKQKRKSAEPVTGTQQPRRCSHCGVQKTPQWRAGPLGAKTLCNACGVRFKSGRLLPEYRPACSPTFSSELHSNHHRKVLEMRRLKETEPELNPPPAAVPSF